MKNNFKYLIISFFKKPNTMNNLIMLFKILSFINLVLFLILISSFYFIDVILYKLFVISLFIGYINLFFLIVLLLKSYKLIFY